MMNRVLILTILLIASFSATAQKRKKSDKKDSNLEINVRMTDDIPDGTIGYRKKKPLRISDFDGAPNQGSGSVGKTYSTINMNYSTRTQNGKTTVEVTIAPYFDPKRSWLKEAGKNERILSHEQLHFDITAWMACKLRQSILDASLTQNNVREKLQDLQQDNFKQWDQAEKQYDIDTRHRLDAAQQQQWVEKVGAALREEECY